MNSKMPVAVQSYAERFAANWKAQNPEDDEDEKSSLDDSLTNLQWLHSISIQDIAPVTTSIAPSPSPSSNSCDSDDRSDTSDGYKDINSKEPNIDYKNDANHKPPYSYATLICMAMRETNKTKITLSAIYKWIKENFMYYRVADPTWQVRNFQQLFFSFYYIFRDFSANIHRLNTISRPLYLIYLVTHILVNEGRLNWYDYKLYSHKFWWKIFPFVLNKFFSIYWRLVFGCFEFLQTCILLRQSGLQSTQTAGHRILWGGLWIWFTNKSHLDSLWIYFIYTCME